MPTTPISTNSTPTPTSAGSATSTTGTAPKWKKTEPAKAQPPAVALAVKRRPLPEVFRAIEVTEADAVTGLGDYPVKVWPGNWLVYRQEQLVNICPTRAVLDELYESADRRTLALDDSARTEIERVLGLGSTTTDRHLVTAISRLARLSIGGVLVDFTPGQWETLAHRAEKRGISVESLVKQIVDGITQQIWDGTA